MVQNKKLGAGLALVLGLIGMFVSSTASALPEMEVGSRIVSAPVQTQVQEDDSTQVADDAEGDDAAADDDVGATSN